MIVGSAGEDEDGAWAGAGAGKVSNTAGAAQDAKVLTNRAKIKRTCHLPQEYGELKKSIVSLDGLKLILNQCITAHFTPMLHKKKMA